MKLPKRLRFALSACGVDPTTVSIEYELSDNFEVRCNIGDEARVLAVVSLWMQADALEFYNRYRATPAAILSAANLTEPQVAALQRQVLETYPELRDLLNKPK